MKNANIAWWTRKYEIRLIIKTLLGITKPKNINQDTKHYIYSIKGECDRQYNGKTKRLLHV